MVSIAGSSGLALGGADVAGDDHGLLAIRAGRAGRPAARAAALRRRCSSAGTSPGRQPANSRSSLGWISAIVVAPTTTSVAWLGLNQVRWNLTRSSRVILRGRRLGARAGPGIGVGVALAVDDAAGRPGAPCRSGRPSRAGSATRRCFRSRSKSAAGNGGMQDDVRVERRARGRGCSRSASSDTLDTSSRDAGAERGAEIGEPVADLRGPCASWCPRRACSSPGSPCPARRTGRPRSRRRAAGRTDLRNRPALGQDDLEPVGERGALERGELRRPAACRAAGRLDRSAPGRRRPRTRGRGAPRACSHAVGEPPRRGAADLRRAWRRRSARSCVLVERRAVRRTPRPWPARRTCRRSRRSARRRG